MLIFNTEITLLIGWRRGRGGEWTKGEKEAFSKVTYCCRPSWALQKEHAMGEKKELLHECRMEKRCWNPITDYKAGWLGTVQERIWIKKETNVLLKKKKNTEEWNKVACLLRTSPFGMGELVCKNQSWVWILKKMLLTKVHWQLLPITTWNCSWKGNTEMKECVFYGRSSELPAICICRG